MRIGLFILSLCLLSPLSSAHLKPQKRSHWVLFKPGPQWNKNISDKKQKHIGEHIAYIQKLYKKDQITIAGFFATNSEMMIVLQNEDLEESRKVIESDPAVANKVLSYEIRPFKLVMLKEHKH